MSLSHDLQFVADLARSAGAIALQYYGHVERLTKTHATTSAEAVTEADRATQRHIVAALQKRFPDDGIIGEESETGESITFDVKNTAGRNWVIDPIDGTNNFIAGIGMFCVCIGLLEAEQPVLGVIYDVTRDLLYCSAKGEGAWLGSKRLHVFDTPVSDASVIMLTSNVLENGRCPAWVTRFMGQTTWKIRVLGSASLEAAVVAAGIAHGCVTVNGKLWDVVPGAAIILEGGGVITNLRGEPIFPFNLVKYIGAKVPFLAAGPKAHPELLKVIRNNP